MANIISKNSLTLLLLIGATQSLPVTADPTQHHQNWIFLSQTEAVMLEELERERGRGGIADITTINDLDVQATLTGNVANNHVTGNNIIDHGAFAGSSGAFTSVIQNSGNNVIIQDSTIVTVTILP